jgi:hypothetical protein
MAPSGVEESRGEGEGGRGSGEESRESRGKGGRRGSLVEREEREFRREAVTNLTATEQLVRLYMIRYHKRCSCDMLHNDISVLYKCIGYHSYIFYMSSI